MKIVQKGFTLIELLIVIAILGVLAAAVVTAINPVKKIKQANDAKIKNDIGQIATAMQAYYTLNASYPAELSTLAAATVQELKVLPVAPTGSAYVLAVSPGTCTTVAKTCTEIAVSAVLLDPAVAGNVWCWRTSTQTTVEAATCPAP